MKKPIFGKRKPQKRVVVDTEEILRKKTHAQIKLLRKAVKKSKQFEIQKIVRRLKQVSHDGKSQDVSEVSKLESVLASLRAADIDRLANLAAASVGILTESTATPAADLATTTDTIEPVDRRILSAKCVVEQLDVTVAALKAIQTKAERQQRNRVEQDDEKDVADDKQEKKRKKASIGSGSEGEERSEESSEEESEIEPDDDALHAIEKLLALKKPKDDGREALASSSDDEEEKEYKLNSEDESDDSGVIENLSEQEEDMMNIDSADEDKQGDYMNSGGSDSDRPRNQRRDAAPSEPAGKKVKAASKPKKSKNRLGQRARKQLGEQQQMQGRNGAPYRQGMQQNKPRQTFKDGGGGSGGGGYREARKDNSRERKSIEKVDEGPLHPSWAARRQEKVKLSIVKAAVEPSNKKIIFGDDGSKKMIVPPPKSASAAASNKPYNQEMVQESEGPLHPSWELKKKMANAQKHMQPAQGKKIVFDD